MHGKASVVDHAKVERFRPLTDEEARAAGFGSAAGIEVSASATFDDVVSSGPFKLFKPRA